MTDDAVIPVWTLFSQVTQGYLAPSHHHGDHILDPPLPRR